MVWSSQSEGGLRRWLPAVCGDGEGPRARAAGGTSRGWRRPRDPPRPLEQPCSAGQRGHERSPWRWLQEASVRLSPHPFLSARPPDPAQALVCLLLRWPHLLPPRAYSRLASGATSRGTGPVSPLPDAPAATGAGTRQALGDTHTREVGRQRPQRRRRSQGRAAPTLPSACRTHSRGSFPR